MKDIKLIIFDLDGTLVNAYPAIIRSVNYAMQKLNYPKQDPLTIKRSVGWGDASLLKPFINPRDFKKALMVYRNHHKTALLKGSSLFPHVKKMLHYLKGKGYKLAVASNRPTKFSLILIRHLGIIKYFDYVLCADKLKHGKPHPEILNKIMRRLKCLAHQSLYVGDMVIDAKAGKRAKIKTVLVSTGSSMKQEIKKAKPFRCITRIAELLKFL
jgi:phosphoglycolate phosphatase